MVNGRNRTTLQDLGFLKDQLPAENKQVKKKPKKKQTSKWPKPGSKIPLQVLQFDDLEILDVQNQAQYRQLFDWQEILSSLLSIQTFNNRAQQVGSLIKDEQPKRERSHRKTEFEKILVRINDDHHNLSNDIHRMRIQKEILALEDQRIRKVLINSVQADSDVWQPLYDELNQRVKLLACEVDTKTGERKKAIVTVQYPWRVRVGGLQGFRERLLPAMHPVYGIPYVPASTIKGILRAWAVENGRDNTQIKHLLGFLEGSKATMAAVEILDAFPEQPSLSVDVATPQWSWQGDNVSYGPSPHQMLSLENLSLNIGVTYTSRGNEADVKTVMGWLEQALRIKGLGSRVSAGYGQAEQIAAPDLTRELPSSSSEQSLTSNALPNFRSEHYFELWSQGIYGANPDEREFRPSAVRGMLRYWFRAIGLGLYSPQHCKELEARLFGTIEPKAVEGSLTIKIQFKENPASLGNLEVPHNVSGTVVLQAKDKHHLNLVQNVLKLATHLGGVGRGARRPLHWNDDDKYSGLRGCYWQPEKKDRLDCNKGIWQDFIKDLRDSFAKVQAPDSSNRLSSGDPGSPGNRCQDVLNTHAGIFLVPFPDMTHPEQMNGRWSTDGMGSDVRGEALDFLYSSPDYKGVNRQKVGNKFVGGKLGTPSFVWIASNNLNIPKQSYQVVTVFGTDHSSKPKGRKQFIDDLQSKLTVIPVWDI
jgi:CRISPR-associated protein Cmr6